MSTSDIDLLKKLESKVGRPFRHVLEGERCVELELASDDCLYHGLIRHHTEAEKEDILRLICRLTELRKLNLRRNRLFRLPEHFRDLARMEQLSLGSNYLGGVPEAIRGFRALKYLHLGNNDIVDVPAWMSDFRQLEYLTLHKNLKIKSIDALAGLKGLKALNLYTLNIFKLPAFVYQFTNLVTLTLWNISDLSDDIANFTQLEFLTHCGCPSVRALPDGLTRLKKLRMARLFQHSLERLPDALGDLENLEQLSVYQNQLSGLPESIARLRKLEKLNLGWNNFETLPAWLNHLTSLEWLGVFGNPLKNGDSIPLPPVARVAREWPFTTLHTSG
jgi:internalin A